MVDESAWRGLTSLFTFYGMVATRSPVIYAVYISPWHGRRHKTNKEVMIDDSEFSVFSVVVCAWSTTRKLGRQLASVGLTQASPNELFQVGLNKDHR